MQFAELCDRAQVLMTSVFIPTVIKNDRWYESLFGAPPPANPARDTNPWNCQLLELMEASSIPGVDIIPIMQTRHAGEKAGRWRFQSDGNPSKEAPECERVRRCRQNQA
jgi:hypothetical protein